MSPITEKKEALTCYLAENELEQMSFFVDLCRGLNSQHVWWFDNKQAARVIVSAAFEDKQIEDNNFRKRYSALESLSVIGFVSFGRDVKQSVTTADAYQLTLLPSAFLRVDYERKSKLSKAIQKILVTYKDAMAVAAFVISLVLAAIKIVEFTHP